MTILVCKFTKFSKYSPEIKGNKESRVVLDNENIG